MSFEQKALRLGATELRPSTRKGKKWAVLYGGSWIHFGATGYEDFTEHKDPARRASYRRRHGAEIVQRTPLWAGRDRPMHISLGGQRSSNSSRPRTGRPAA